MTHDRRITQLEQRTVSEITMLVYRYRAKPDGTAQPAIGFTMPDGSTVMKRENESVTDLKGRASEQARKSTVASFIELRAVHDTQ